MKTEHVEGSVNNEGQSFRHVALSLESGKRIEAKIGALEDSHHRFAYVDDACELPVRAASNHEGDGPSAANPLQVLLVFVMGTGRKNPGPMQTLAANDGGEKLLFIIGPSSGEEYAR